MLLSSIARVGAATKIGQRLSAGAIIGGIRGVSLSKMVLKDAARVTGKAFRGMNAVWNKYPRIRRTGVGVIVGGMATMSGASGFIKGFRAGMVPEEMYNRAHGYGEVGMQEYFRNQGRMPSNHMGHSGLGLAMSRRRHG